MVDVDGRCQQWVDAVGYEAVVIRPDFYVFGGAASAAEVPALLDQLFGQLEHGRLTADGPVALATGAAPEPGAPGWSIGGRTG